MQGPRRRRAWRARACLDVELEVGRVELLALELEVEQVGPQLHLEVGLDLPRHSSSHG